jgi:aldose 1-epimerase
MDMTRPLPPLPPSGQQIELAHGSQRAVVVTVGAGLRTYDVEGRAVLDGYGEDAMCDGARGQTLVPWPNRVQDGAWTWRGDDNQLALTEPAQHNAIHGLLRWVSWDVAERSDAAVTMTTVAWPRPGWQWPLEVSVTYTLGPGGLVVEQAVVNRGTSAAPVAAGAHPYLTVGTPTIDTAVLHLPGRTYLPTGDQQIPTGRAPVDGTPYDFREPRAIGDTQIDYTFTDLDRDADGRFRLRLTSPAGEAAVTLWTGPAYPFVEVFTGDALPDASRRRQGLGVEPMTAPPNALASGESLVVLDPGARWCGEWGITLA